MGRVIHAFMQFFDSDGDPLSLGWLKFLESGSNNTLKNTYNDSQMQIPNENPLQLDADGRCPNVFGTGDYRVVSYTQDIDDEEAVGEQIQQFDPVTAQGTIFSDSGFAFNTWNVTITYGLGDIVESSGYYYRSLISANVGNNPATSEFAWERISFLPWWNSSVSYTQGYLIQYTGGIYFSSAGSNLNNDPDSSPAWWISVSDTYSSFSSKTADYSIVVGDANTIFSLGSGAGASKTFDLPTVSASYDRLRLAFYNANASYNLDIDPVGSDIINAGNSGPLTIYPGSFAELIYYYDIDTWLVIGSVGQAFSNQIIGTAADPVNVLHINQINVYSTYINLMDDIPIHFGTGQDAKMVYVSADNELQFFFNSVKKAFYDASSWGFVLPVDVEIGRTTTRIAPAGTYVTDGSPVISTTVLAFESGSAFTWATVGPTSSGATNIWTALDSVPDDADWIEVAIYTKIENVVHAASTAYSVDVYARKNGDSSSIGRENRISSIGVRSDSSGYGWVRDTARGIKIPVDSNIMFEIEVYLVPDPNTSAYAYLHLTGWGYNPTA